MPLEIEVLVHLDEPKSSALAKLSKLGEPVVKRTVDIYYADPLRPELNPDGAGRLTHCFRLRQQEGKPSRLTWKDDFFGEDGHWICSDELETAVGEAETVAAILGRLGLTELMRLDIEKTTWQSGRFEVVLEDVVGLGLFLEVEVEKEEGNCNLDGAAATATVEDTKHEIREFISQLGLAIGPETDAGKPEMMLARQKIQ